MKIFVRPAPGLRVLGPDGVAVPDGGLEVESSSFWLRRIKDGDVISVARDARTESRGAD